MEFLQELIASALAGFHGAVAAGGFICGLVVLWLWLRILALLVESFVDFWRG